MNVATLSFIEPDTDADGADVMHLNHLVMTAFDRHFSTYSRAAAAMAEYRTVQAMVRDDDSLSLFDAGETMRTALDAHPQAGIWAAFEREATEAIQPFGFSMRFSGNDNPTREERP